MCHWLRWVGQLRRDSVCHTRMSNPNDLVRRHRSSSFDKFIRFMVKKRCGRLTRSEVWVFDSVSDVPRLWNWTVHRHGCNSCRSSLLLQVGGCDRLDARNIDNDFFVTYFRVFSSAVLMMVMTMMMKIYGTDKNPQCIKCSATRMQDCSTFAFVHAKAKVYIFNLVAWPYSDNKRLIWYDAFRQKCQALERDRKW